MFLSNFYPFLNIFFSSEFEALEEARVISLRCKLISLFLSTLQRKKIFFRVYIRYKCCHCDVVCEFRYDTQCLPLTYSKERTRINLFKVIFFKVPSALLSRKWISMVTLWWWYQYEISKEISKWGFLAIELWELKA